MYFHAVVTLAIFVVFGGAAYPLYLQSDPSDETQVNSQSHAIPVATQKLVRHEYYEVSRRFTGVVKSARQSTLSFQHTGQVVELLVDEGETVEQGAVIARLGKQRLNSQRSKVLADCKQAEARLRELQSGSRKQEIEAATAEVNQFQAESRLLLNRWKRAQALHERSAISQDELEQANSSWKSIEARTQASIARRDVLVAGPRSETIQAQLATVKSLQASLDEIDIQLEQSVLVAPYAGTVSRRFLDEGVVVSAGEPVVDLVEVSKLEFHVGLPVSLVRGLQSQETFSLKLGKYSLDVSWERVLPALNPSTRTQTVIFSIPDSFAVVPGETAELLVSEKVRESGYWIPHTALKEGVQGLWSCYVVDQSSKEGNATVESRDIEVLHVEEDAAFVRGVLSAGEELVTIGIHRLVEKQAVVRQPSSGFDRLVASVSRERP